MEKSKQSIDDILPEISKSPQAKNKTSLGKSKGRGESQSPLKNGGPAAYEDLYGGIKMSKRASDSNFDQSGEAKLANSSRKLKKTLATMSQPLLEPLVKEGIEEGALFEAQKARIQIDNNAMLLSNRIAMLEQEERRMQKKIDETRRRAKEIMDIKIKNEERYNKKMRDKVESLDMIRSAQQYNLDAKEKRNKEMHDKLMNIYNSKSSEAKYLKKQSKENADTIKEFKMSDVNQKQSKKEEILYKEKEALHKKIEEKKRQLMNYREDYKNRVSSEVKAIENRKTEIEKMEKRETDLLNRIKNTQQVELAAKQDLEKALSYNNNRKSTTSIKGTIEATSGTASSVSSKNKEKKVKKVKRDSKEEEQTGGSKKKVEKEEVKANTELKL